MPATEMRPEAAGNNPFKAPIRVVLPTPERPTTAVMVPGAKASETSRRTSRSPRRTVNLSTVTLAPRSSEGRDIGGIASREAPARAWG